MSMKKEGEPLCHRLVFVGADRSPSLLAETIHIPELKDGEILAKVRLATICSSDLHTILGRRCSLIPSALGHEAVLEVLAHKRGRESGLQVGQRITFSVADVCASCDRCRVGLPQKCRSLFKYGHSQITSERPLSGCYATHIILHPGTNVYSIPDHVSDKMAAPINCSLATMVNAILSFSHQDADKKAVLLQGAGLLGVYGCAFLHHTGFRKVFVSDVDEYRLRSIPSFGGIPVIAGGESTLFKENELDIVIEVCGVSGIIQSGIQLLKPGGTYVLVGLVHPDSYMNITAESIIRKCLTIKGIHNYAPEHLQRAVEFMSAVARKYPFEQLIGAVYPLAEFETAFEKAKTGKFRRVAMENTT
ncbi:L-threonine 3-dehydrogenase-like [Diadema antillarum]|uniref:L-threonine 3-dehydrogenase-like n=1 Tax=Diadema antillarum TaxID=105358 RepID=UPI003A83BB82